MAWNSLIKSPPLALCNSGSRSFDVCMKIELITLGDQVDYPKSSGSSPTLHILHLCPVFRGSITTTLANAEDHDGAMASDQTPSLQHSKDKTYFTKLTGSRHCPPKACNEPFSLSRLGKTLRSTASFRGILGINNDGPRWWRTSDLLTSGTLPLDTLNIFNKIRRHAGESFCGD
jgi:hypothetical protein